MVHVRLNERETNPNPHINFISALPTEDLTAQEDARQLLRALAAQVRPVMKAHGFVVNSFEEYEHNKVFAGRNWNAGEVVELVLRGASGTFLPVSWLMSTLCHELAHIQHMNHGRAFQALWAKLRNEVRELQSKGYYGDGYWSSGTRLADSTRIGGQSLSASDMPEYMCGGAQTRTRPTALRRRRRRQQAGPSNHTGAQTAKKRKAGSRVTAQGTFKGTGKALNEGMSDDEQKNAGTGFRKKAGSQRAREERALAAERRLQALQNQASTSTAPPLQTREASEELSSDDEAIPETDQDRRRAMLDSMENVDLEGLKVSRTDFSEDFMLPRAASTSSRPPVSPSPDEDDGVSCDVQILPTPSATAAGGPSTSSTRRDRKRKQAEEQSQSLEDWLVPVETKASSARKKAKQDVPYGSLVEDELLLRKRESLGMAGSGRRLGGNRPGTSSSVPRNIRPNSHCPTEPRKEPHAVQRSNSEADREWPCLVCTLSNAPEHLACSACATPRGESGWVGHHT